MAYEQCSCDGDARCRACLLGSVHGASATDLLRASSAIATSPAPPFGVKRACSCGARPRRYAGFWAVRSAWRRALRGPLLPFMSSIPTANSGRPRRERVTLMLRYETPHRDQPARFSIAALTRQLFVYPSSTLIRTVRDTAIRSGRSARTLLASDNWPIRSRKPCRPRFNEQVQR